MRLGEAVVVLGLLTALPASAQDAADQHYDRATMQEARDQLRREHGGATSFFVQADRFEYQTDPGSGALLWEGQGWVGGDYNRFWVKTEGEYLGETGGWEEAEIQGLYTLVRFVIVSPNMHRVHHSIERVETDSNYSSVLSIWDRLFRSYREKPDYRQIRFGVEGFLSDRSQSLRGLLSAPIGPPNF